MYVANEFFRNCLLGIERLILSNYNKQLFEINVYRLINTYFIASFDKSKAAILVIDSEM